MTLPLRKAWPAFAVFAVSVLFASASSAADRALLVGVSNYPKDMVGDLQLQGPKNDVALMLRTLRERGFQDRDMIVLADSMEDTGEKRPTDAAPTRAAIMAALDRLAQEAQPGEQVVIMLSGHGSQAPITNPASLIHHPDGLNPIFLPIDIGKWNDTAGKVDNMIAGDEFGEKLAAIRAKGAFVWVIVDACHSGTITRGAEEGVLAKKIAPAVLGVPSERLEAARRMAEAARPKTRSITDSRPKPASPLGAQRDAKGGYVAFFAAHPDELALQRNLPKGYDAEDKRPHGILVFYLVQAMRTGRAQSYADLAQMVLAGYDQWGASAPSPLFEGDLRAGILGAKADGPRTFPARVEGGRLRLDAGVLDEVEEGAIIALAAAEKPAEILGHARVTRPGASAASLEPVAYGGMAAPTTRELDYAGRLSGRMIERGVGLEMRVAIPAEAEAGPEAARAMEALRALEKGEESVPAAIRFVGTPAPADVFLSVSNGRIWFSPATGEVVKSGRALTPNLQVRATSSVRAVSADIARVLRAHLKVRNLIRAAEALGAGPGGQSLEISLAVAPPAATTVPAGARSPDDFECEQPSLDRLPEGVQPLASPAELPPLSHCDTVYFSLRNRGKRVIDVTPLYVDSGGAVDYMGPQEGLRLLPDAPARIIPVQVLTFDRQRGAPFPVGLERLLFIAVEQDDKTSLPADFRYLQQAALPRTQTPRGGSSALRSLLEEAAFGVNRTRSASAGPSIGDAGIVQFRWKVKAPE
jgi:hypothetical protein